jgi:hypothetical protein
VAARRKRRLRPTGERGDRVAAVRLVPDDDHGLPAALRCRANVLRRGARREPLVDLRLSEAECDGRLPRTQERARDDGVRDDALLAEPAAELPGLLAAERCEDAQLVRAPRAGLGVADDQEAQSSAKDRRPSARASGM